MKKGKVSSPLDACPSLFPYWDWSAVLQGQFNWNKQSLGNMDVDIMEDSVNISKPL